MSVIRLATEADAEQILAIYAPFCLPDSAVSFEFTPPSLTEMNSRITSTLERLPWLVASEASDASKVYGYAYASAHRNRAAYDWSVDTSVYISALSRGKGVGKELYTRLFSILRLQGYVNAYAGIALPNPASVRLHTSVGFSHLGTYHQVGFKNRAWHDVAWYELLLEERTKSPPPPRPLPELSLEVLGASL